MWVTAYDARDLSGTMAIFDPGVVFQFQGASDQDYAELERGYRAHLPTPTRLSIGRAVARTRVGLGHLADVYSSWRIEVSEGGQTRVTQTQSSRRCFPPQSRLPLAHRAFAELPADICRKQSTYAGYGIRP